jgi:hypothetical protein
MQVSICLIVASSCWPKILVFFETPVALLLT